MAGELVLKVQGIEELLDLVGLLHARFDTQEALMSDLSAALDAQTAEIHNMAGRIDDDVRHLQDLYAQALAADVADKARADALMAEADKAVLSITSNTAALRALDPLTDFPAAPPTEPPPVETPPVDTTPPPVEQPPVEQPPTETPPVVTPPEQPPVEPPVGGTDQGGGDGTPATTPPVTSPPTDIGIPPTGPDGNPATSAPPVLGDTPPSTNV